MLVVRPLFLVIIVDPITLTVPHLERFKEQPDARLKVQIYIETNQKVIYFCTW